MTAFPITIAWMSAKIPKTWKITDYLNSFLPLKTKWCTYAKFPIDAYLKTKL